MPVSGRQPDIAKPAGTGRKRPNAEAAISITSINEVMAFRDVRQRVVWIERDRAVGWPSIFAS
jgi:hypothetical protein